MYSEDPEWRVFPMRKVMLFLIVFALAGSLWAADPIIGTWKLNISKSKFRSGQQVTAKARTDVYREIDSAANRIDKNRDQDGRFLQFL